ncbi:MAG: hypothetical protein ABIR79_23185 [Candidatus Binatia bacterium]
MNGRRWLAVLCAAAMTASAGGCAHDPDAFEPEVSRADGATVDEAQPGPVHLDADGVRRAGVKSAVVERAERRAEVEAFGRVLDPLPLVEALQARAAATAVATVAHAEYERVARLHRDDQNASTRDLEAARATLDKATADLRGASARLTLGWGAAGEAGDAVIDGLVAGRLALVRVDLPAGMPPTVPPTAVTILGRAARVLGRAPTVDPLVQGDGWLALVDGDPPRPGAVLAVRVAREPEPTAGVAVPATALVWVDGHPTLYTEPAPGEFERRTLTLGARMADDWIVTAGVAPGERVVVAGAARLLSSQVMRAEPGAD